jgi:hypothetical protein
MCDLSTYSERSHFFTLGKFWDGLHSTYDKGLQITARLMHMAPESIEISLKKKACLREELSREVLEDDGDYHLLLTLLTGYITNDLRMELFAHMTRALLSQQLTEYNGQMYWPKKALGMPLVLQSLRKKNIWRKILEEDIIPMLEFCPQSPFLVNVLFFLTVAYIFYRDDPELGPKLDTVPGYIARHFDFDMFTTVFFCNPIDNSDDTVYNVHEIEMFFASLGSLTIKDFMAAQGVELLLGLICADKSGVLTARIHALVKELLFRRDSQPLHVEFLVSFVEETHIVSRQELLDISRALYLSTYVLPIILCALQITGLSETGTIARAPQLFNPPC